MRFAKAPRKVSNDRTSCGPSISCRGSAPQQPEGNKTAAKRRPLARLCFPPHFCIPTLFSSSFSFFSRLPSLSFLSYYFGIMARIRPGCMMGRDYPRAVAFTAHARSQFESWRTEFGYFLEKYPNFGFSLPFPDDR